MTDMFTKSKRSEIMSKIRGKDTKLELSFRRALWESGLRGWRVHYGKFNVDVAFVGRKVAIFIDGCFWHGCPKHFRAPKTNRGYWIPKIRGNRERDRRATKELETKGWRVVRIWEHDLKRIKDVVGQVAEIIRGVRGE